MGFKNLSIVTELVLAQHDCRAGALAEVVTRAGLSTLIVDGSMLLHHRPLTREAALAVLLAHVHPTAGNIASAATLAEFSSESSFGTLLLRLQDVPLGQLQKVTLVLERASTLFVKTILFLFFFFNFNLHFFPSFLL